MVNVLYWVTSILAHIFTSRGRSVMQKCNEMSAVNR